MDNIRTYIESGILESYILGHTSPTESKDIEAMAATSLLIREELESITDAIAVYAQANSIVPNPTIKPLLLAAIDYSERLRNGEKPSNPAILHEGSKVIDYSEWLSRKDMAFPDDFVDFHAKIIAQTNEALTAIVWIKEMAPQEVHDNEFEKFLIIEGSCMISIEGEIHQLQAGDYLSIPLHKKHFVTVTSTIPCKVILQRVAA